MRRTYNLDKSYIFLTKTGNLGDYVWATNF